MPYRTNNRRIGDWHSERTVHLFPVPTTFLHRRYLYVAIIYNTCYTIALYYLLLFYVGCEELLEVGGSLQYSMTTGPRAHVPKHANSGYAPTRASRSLSSRSPSVCVCVVSHETLIPCPCGTCFCCPPPAIPTAAQTHPHQGGHLLNVLAGECQQWREAPHHRPRHGMADDGKKWVAHC